MKVVILAGGYGSRIADYSELPKPMIPIGKYPIIVHIMKIYIKYGFKDLIIPIGYKGKIIQNYFSRLKNNFHYITPRSILHIPGHQWFVRIKISSRM